MPTVSRLHPASPAGPIVAIHCSASSPRQWEPYRALLAPGTALATPHLLGYDSAREWVNGVPVTLEEEAQNLLPAFWSLDRPAHLVAHSYGGTVALQFALLWPQKLRSLTLYEPSAFALLAQDPASARQAEEIHAAARRVTLLALSGRRNEAGELFVDYWSGPGAWSRMPPHRRADVALRMSKVRAEFGAIFESRMDLRKLQDFDFPVRLVYGDRSPAPSRRVVERLRALVPRAEAVCVPGLRHMAPLADREVLVPLLFPYALRRELPLAA